jgi:hypothetical protein
VISSSVTRHSKSGGVRSWSDGMAYGEIATSFSTWQVSGSLHAPRKSPPLHCVTYKSPRTLLKGLALVRDGVALNAASSNDARSAATKVCSIAACTANDEPLFMLEVSNLPLQGFYDFKSVSLQSHIILSARIGKNASQTPTA